MTTRNISSMYVLFASGAGSTGQWHSYMWA